MTESMHASSQVRLSGDLNSHESQVLNGFYGKFPYPWRPMRFDLLSDPTFYTSFLCQDLGDFSLSRIPSADSIWVAGCGTNQALLTAVRFPLAQVLGTDASAVSLEICQENARRLGVTNLELAQEGIAQARYSNQFDYVICTGVIHHNPDPSACLRRLSGALRTNGVLELMVYNTFQRREPVAFQQALRLLAGERTDDRDRLDLARRLANAVPSGTPMAKALAAFEDPFDEAWADTWMHPCEHTYTLDALWELAEGCGLHVEAPAVSPFDQATGTFSWHLEFGDEELQQRFDSLNDRTRWQLVNLLKLDDSPMLWFYLTLAARPRVTEAERVTAFLDAVLSPAATRRRTYVLDECGRYKAEPKTSSYPVGRPSADARAVFDAADGRRTTRELFKGLGLTPTLATLHRARLALTTSRFPFLLANRSG